MTNRDQEALQLSLGMGAVDSDSFDILGNKGKWESTLWKTEACRPFVNEESRSTRTLDDSLGWNEEAFKAFIKALVSSVSNLSDLVRVYRKHQPRYNALSHRLTLPFQPMDVCTAPKLRTEPS